jgi:hypothetical protein
VDAASVLTTCSVLGLLRLVWRRLQRRRRPLVLQLLLLLWRREALYAVRLLPAAAGVAQAAGAAAHAGVRRDAGPSCAAGSDRSHNVSNMSNTWP